jgi:hypothetical protein
MNKTTGIIFIILFSLQTLMAQTNDVSNGTNQNILGINFNTNAGLLGGFFYRNTSSKDSKYLFRNLGIELVEVKHPKEVKQTSAYGNTYIYGKVNDFYVLRPQAGLEVLLFSKGADDGIQIHGILMGGISIGILKPYVVQYQIDSSKIAFVGFNPNLYDPNKIISAGGFFYGWDNLTYAIGAHAKTGLNFEFSPYGSDAVTGIEIGLQFEAFNREIPMLDLFSASPTTNYQIFTSLYLNIFFGFSN